MRISDWSSDVCSSDLLKAIFSVGAGIDHLASDPDLPPGIPIVRMVEPGLTAGLSEYVVLAVLSHRSEERRVGQGCVSTCRSRWSSYHAKNKVKDHVNTIRHKLLK